MSGIDLIPRSFRDALRVRRILKAALLGSALLAATGITGSRVLSWQLGSERAELVRLRGEAARNAELRKQIEGLGMQKAALGQQASALAILRGNGEILRTARAIDAAMNPGVWLTSYRFSRIQQPLDATQASAPVPNGYVVINAAAAPSDGQKDGAWRLSSQVDLQGTAINHTYLGDFMKALARQPGIVEVRFLSSNASGDDAAQAVQFGAAATVHTGSKAAP